MTIEAMFQTARGSNMEGFSHLNSVNMASYRLRNVRVLRALVLEEDQQHHLYLSLHAAQGQADTWFRFKIFSLRDESWTEHCDGFVRIGPLPSAPVETCTVEPLRYPSPAKLWYKSMRSVGFNFGPAFQSLHEIESVAGQRLSRARIRFPGPSIFEAKQSQYAIHPSVFDAFFQAGIPSLYQGHRTWINKALVPRLIDEIAVNPTAEAPSSALAITSSAFTTGRPDKTQNYTSNASIYDEKTGHLIAKIRGLHYTELDVPEAEKDAPKTAFMRVSWKPDISLLPDSLNLDALAAVDAEAAVLAGGLRLPPAAAYLMSLLKHKRARPSVLDLNMFAGQREEPLTVTEVDEAALRRCLSAFCRYSYASAAPSHNMEVQKQLPNVPGLEFHVHDAMATRQGERLFDAGTKFDLVVLRVRPAEEREPFEAALRTARELCTSNTYVLLIVYSDLSLSNGNPSQSGPGKTTGACQRRNIALESLLSSVGFGVRTTDTSSFGRPVYLLAPLESDEAREAANHQYGFQFPIIDLSEGTSKECSALISSLRALGWTGDLIKLSEAANLQPDSHEPLGLADDPQSPLLARVTEFDWDNLRRLLRPGRRLVWLTQGSQFGTVSSPSSALVHGFVRSVGNEEPTLSITTLDLSSFANAPELAAQSTLRVVMAGLHDAACAKDEPDRAAKHMVRETEYCEHDGLLHVSRLLPDETLIAEAARDEGATELREMWLRKNPRTARAFCERVGSMDSIHFNEVARQPVLGDGEVEVEIRAAGLNFKVRTTRLAVETLLGWLADVNHKQDIATCLGIVPEDEHLLGFEGAGVIRQVGSKVCSYQPGDRVLVHAKGSFANRVCVPKESIFLLPSSLSFEEAATMSIVYFTAVYSLMELARLKKGQSILIHSAAGGVGLASIQVCRYLGVEVYATVGNDEKKRFLAKQYGIAPERIFSSRTIGFVAGIQTLTQGRGVDAVLNFLTGDLLDESWRLLADNGILLEIGKKDIIDRNTLSMEPFNRNCKYLGIDISHPSVLHDLPLVERVLQKIRQLLVDGHIKPISPMKVFPFSQIRDAMRYMRSGQHMGKIVLSQGDEDDIRVPVRPAPRTLAFDPEAAYLIIGGLKGLCGSLAVYMARHGARNLIIMSRSGADDRRSRSVISDLESLGTTATIAKGSVSSLEDTTRVFRESVLPIKGIIHGAMLLRVRLSSFRPSQQRSLNRRS
jgi:NADPH:quinone reductase-like Zn-dependent oxidoreductase